MGRSFGCVMGGVTSYAESVESSRAASCSAASMPSLMESSDREMLPSWVLGSRLRDMARCLSSKESLMWSARRYSCGGLAILIGLERRGPADSMI